MAAIGPVPSGRVELLSSNLGPAAAATSMRGPSETWPTWPIRLGRLGGMQPWKLFDFCCFLYHFFKNVYRCWV